MFTYLGACGRLTKQTGAAACAAHSYHLGGAACSNFAGISAKGSISNGVVLISTWAQLRDPRNQCCPVDTLHETTRTKRRAWNCSCARRLMRAPPEEGASSSTKETT